MKINNKMRLLILGYYTSIDKAYLNFKTSLEKFMHTNYKFIKTNPGIHIKEISKAIQESDADIIMIVNMNESIICANAESIIHTFTAFNTPIVFGTQSLKEGLELKKWWYHKKLENQRLNLEKSLRFRNEFVIPDNQYANTRNFIAYATIIPDFIYMPSIDFFIELNPTKCALDLESKLFGNITVKSNDLLHFRHNQGRIQDKRSLAFPCIVTYPNSRTDLHLRMYKYGKIILGNQAHFNLDIKGFFMGLVQFIPLIFINRLSIQYVLILMCVIGYLINYFLALCIN